MSQVKFSLASGRESKHLKQTMKATYPLVKKNRALSGYKGLITLINEKLKKIKFV